MSEQDTPPVRYRTLRLGRSKGMGLLSVEASAMSLPAWSSRIQAACFAATLDFEDVCLAAGQYPVVGRLRLRAPGS